VDELWKEDLVIVDLTAEPGTSVTTRLLADDLRYRVSSGLHLVPVPIIIGTVR
jgi:hypothetical protein